MFPLLGSSCKLSIASPSSHSTSASFCGQVKKELTSYQSNVDSPCGTFIQRRLSLWKVEFPPHIPSPSLLPSFRKVRNGKKSSSRVSDSVRSQDALALHCPKASRMKSVPAERLPSQLSCWPCGARQRAAVFSVRPRQASWTPGSAERPPGHFMVCNESGTYLGTDSLQGLIKMHKQSPLWFSFPVFFKCLRLYPSCGYVSVCLMTGCSRDYQPQTNNFDKNLMFRFNAACKILSFRRIFFQKKMFANLFFSLLCLFLFSCHCVSAYWVCVLGEC